MRVHRSPSSVTGKVAIVKRFDMMEDAKGVNQEDVGGGGRNARTLYSRDENQRSLSEILEPKVYIHAYIHSHVQGRAPSKWLKERRSFSHFDGDSCATPHLPRGTRERPAAVARSLCALWSVTGGRE